MDKETLDRFLTIPGVTGIALLGRKSRPYFYRSFQELGKRQQDALIQGLFQVLESMPSGFDFFDFQFAQQRVFVYPLNQEWVLLVAADDNLNLSRYDPAIRDLREDLQQDTHRGLAVFRLFTSHQEGLASIPFTPEAAMTSNGATLTAVPVPEFLQAVNHLCQVTVGYLGRAVIVNYWKMARDQVLEVDPTAQALLESFQVERSAEIRYTGALQHLDPEQHQQVRAWVVMFIKRCEEVIRNFRSVLQTNELSPQEWRLLVKG